MSLSAAYCLRHPLTVVTIRKFFASDSSSPLPVLAILLFETDDTGRFLQRCIIPFAVAKQFLIAWSTRAC